MSAPIGALRARIRLERPAPDPDDGMVAWEEVATVWAAIAFTDIVRFELRLRRDVRSGWRVALGDRRFRIVALRDGADARLLLDCEEETT